MLFVQIFIFLYPILLVVSDGLAGIKLPILLLKIVLILSLGLYMLTNQTKVKKSFSRQSKNIHTLVITFLFINIVSCIRGFYNGVFSQASLAFSIVNLIFFYVVGRFTVTLEEKEKITSSLYLGILFYALAEIFLFYFPILKFQTVLGFTNEIIDPSNSIAGLFGIQSDRMVFPLASSNWGATHAGSIVGVLFVASCINLIYTDLINGSILSENRFRDLFRFAIHCVSIVSTLWIIVLSDSRAAFLGCFISVLTFLILKILLFTRLFRSKSSLKYIPYIFISFYLFSFFFASVKSIMLYVLQFTNLNRGASIEAFSNRDIIWESVLNLFAEFSPDQIMGYGVWGQYVSGVSKSYERFLFSSSSSNYFTLHSTILQNLIDTGYLVIFVYICLTFLVLKFSKTIFLKKISRHSNDPQPAFSIFSSSANLGVLFYLIIVGGSDAVITMSRLFSLDIYLVLVMSSLTLVPSRQHRF